MKIALLGHNKLGLVDESATKDKLSENMGCHWERVDAIVLYWVVNSVSKNLLGGIMYASNAQNVWQVLFERFNKIDGSRNSPFTKKLLR